MKYDRPVWQLMHECADAMPPLFRYDDVRTWFSSNYPEVGDATIRAHVVGLTDGGAKHPQFQRRSPIFRRVARGQYEPIPLADRGELPIDDPGQDEPNREITGRMDLGAPTRRESTFFDQLTQIEPEPEAPMPGPEPEMTAEEFWPFPGPADEAPAEASAEPVVEPTAEPTVATTVGADDKAAKRARKAARREAKRIAALEVERARRELAAAQDAQPEPEAVPEAEPEIEEQPSWREEIEAERARLAAARDETRRREDDVAANRAAAEAEIEAERRRLAAERSEMARIAAERAESGRLAGRELEAERARIAAERAEADRMLAEQVEVRSAERVELVRREAERTAAAQLEAERLQAARAEAERVAATEKKRVSKLRKAARQERELAEILERDRLERKARRKAERRARENAERHLAEAAERRRLEEEERRLAALSVRDDLARLEREARARIEAERAPEPDPEPPAPAFVQPPQPDPSVEADEVDRAAQADREAFERAEADRLAFEREERERQQLEREEEQLRESLASATEPPRLVLDDAAADPFDDPFGGAGTDEPAAPESSHGGIVIVRAPRPPAANDDRGDLEPPAAAESDLVTPPPSIVPEAFVPDTVDADDETIVLREPSDAIVLGSLGERLGVPAPARDAYRDLAFQLARRDAERSGARWFVLSAEHGLLEPQEWVSPDDRSITDIDPRHRAVWASWVAARLELLVGDLHGLAIHVDAPDEIAAPVIDALGDAGAEITTGTAIHVPPAVQSAQEDEHAVPDVEDVDDVVAAPAPEPEIEPATVTEPEPQPTASAAQVLPFLRVGSVADHLTDQRHAVAAPLAAALPHHPGLYAWSVDHAGARMLNRALMLPVRAGVIYVGQVGARSGLPEPVFSLNDHVTRVQLHGRARASTFRMNLATTLAQLLGLHTIEDPRLTQWMLDHLSVTVWPSDDIAHLRELQTSVVDDLRPVLNIEPDQAVEYRRRIAELRGRLA